MRVACINLHVSSDAEHLVEWLAGFFQVHDVAVVLLSECTPRHAAELRRLGNYRLLRKNEYPGQGECPVLVRNDIPTMFWNTKRMTPTWVWKKPKPSRWMTYAVIRGVVFASIHQIPGVDVSPEGLDGRWSLKRGWRVFMRRLRRFGKRIGPFVFGGDWNDPAAHRGKYSVRWLANKLQAKVRTEGGIDYVVGRDVELRNPHKFKGGPGMDHPIFMIEVND